MNRDEWETLTCPDCEGKGSCPFCSSTGKVYRRKEGKGMLVTVSVNPDDLPPLYCLTGAGPSPWGNYQSVNCGCEEDLRPIVLEMWDGTQTPFTVQCPCGNVYEVKLRMDVDADVRFVEWKGKGE